MKPLYSVIILTYNRANILPIALRSILEQTVQREEYEIIIIDDESTDNTPEIVSDFIGKHADISILYRRVEHGGEARGRNIGIREARGKYIFFTDDDCVVPPNWIEHFADIYGRHPEIAGVGGTSVAPPELLAKNKIIQYRDLKMFIHRTLDTIDRSSSSFIMHTGVGNTANMSYRRDVLLGAGGFDERQNFSGSVDFELKNRIMNRGLKLYYTPLHTLHLKEYKTVKDLFRLGIIRARGIRFYAEKSSDLRACHYGYHSIKEALSGALRMLKNGPRKLVLYHLVDNMGRFFGWYYARIRGPHHKGWEKVPASEKK